MIFFFHVILIDVRCGCGDDGDGKSFVCIVFLLHIIGTRDFCGDEGDDG